MKSSPSIWHYVVSVKSTVKISSIFVPFLENMNFIRIDGTNLVLDNKIFEFQKISSSNLALTCLI